MILFIVVYSIINLSQNEEIVIIERKNFSLKYNYTNNKWYQPYYDFPKSHPKLGILHDELLKGIPNYDTNKSYFHNLSNDEITKIIIKGLNIEFLLKDINNQDTIVTTIRKYESQIVNEKELLFTDDHVGTFNVLLLKPKQNKTKYPAVIVLHGHGDDIQIAKKTQFGQALAENGFVVIIPFIRIFKWDEYDITKNLYENGFSLMGLMVYETLLVTKYLKYLDFVDYNKIGITSHSGGNCIANLLVRITDDIKVQVRSLQCDYLNPGHGKYNCERLPYLHWYHKDINDFRSLNIKVLYYDYNSFTNEKKIILDFFNENLKEEIMVE